MAIAEVSMTRFVDFVLKAGSPKLTVVRQWKADKEAEYARSADYYRSLREEIIRIHHDVLPMSQLSELLLNLKDGRKHVNYKLMVDAYQAWCKKKSISWFAPKKSAWSLGELPILVNPELGLVIDGQPHLVKLYFKDEPIKKNRIEPIGHLMQLACKKSMPKDCLCSILDVRRGKLHTPDVPVSGLTIQLECEATYWVKAWESLERTDCK